jgi:hypothetical protein
VLEDIDWTEDMPVPIKRRVKALKEVQAQYEELMKDFIKERAALQAKYEKAAGGCLIVSGVWVAWGVWWGLGWEG